jgi:hypothetical protein
MAKENLKLSKETYANLLTAEGKLTQWPAILDKLEECGVECEPMRQLIQDKLAQMSAIKKNFAPISRLSET